MINKKHGSRLLLRYLPVFILMAALGYIGKYEEISCDCDLAEIGKKCWSAEKITSAT